ncbi:reverse transcriptase domain-containing protein [Neptuniibacter sp. 2_MG-2023]|uniref:reverse transcriptase domain-containing protein n=1 Tax=Neptuniibacter sp. 2_MG-2023 TaxID=3062671 RepID=UPI0026E221DD|nr:reverse transcriptase domain-containing protein [Neptuniibacter sp. 2_MG-2023]MDO6512598.1 reverse transcriptase domain-containing protein [Neptuniibacter sp. 2_MG-2023]
MMNTLALFKETFSVESLREIYETSVAQTRATGVDNISTKIFERDLQNHLELINKKVLNGKYKFTRYKQKLISKGPNKAPREVCLPTIRDRVVLKALNQFLQERMGKQIPQPLPQLITKNIKKSLRSNYYDVVLKFDVSEFYPSVKHDVLRKRLLRFVQHDLILNLIEAAIKQSTGNISNKKGVPQGLPISNILAALYLRKIDRRYEAKDEIFYQRYVDDILVLCKSHQKEDVSSNIINICQDIGLTVYDPIERPDKSTCGQASDEFSYIGYRYNPIDRSGVLVTTKPESKIKLINSLTGIFTSFHRSKKKSLALLQWRVNLRITGCISENSGKGWLFFFSEIEDKQLLFELDQFVASLCKRFDASFPRKKFVRAWHEINHNRWRKKYFPNFDKYDLNEMSLVVATYLGKDVSELEMTEEEITTYFWRAIKKEIKDMETDIQDHNYK